MRFAASPVPRHLLSASWFADHDGERCRSRRTDAVDAQRRASNGYACRIVSIGSIVIRVDDLERQAAFWSAALDYVPRGPERGDDESFVLLRPRDGSGPNVSLDRVRSALQIPPRIHLDLYTDDQSGEVTRLIGLGASEVQWDRKPADADYVILADPEGNRFCVIDTKR